MCFKRIFGRKPQRNTTFCILGRATHQMRNPRRSCVEELMRIVREEREKKRKAMVRSGELARLENLKRQQEEEEFASLGTVRRGRRPTKSKAPHITKKNPLHEPVNLYDGCFIAHFASFEKSCLEKLGQLVDQYKGEIKQFYFLDTLDLFKRGFVHPNAHGSNSLKKVLPGLCPDFKYGVFGGDSSDEMAGEAEGADGSGERQDEQKGENAMGVYRLWHHHEGGGSLMDVQRTVLEDEHRRGVQCDKKRLVSLTNTARPEVRDKAWAMLRIQLLEYCSLDTKALYEIMRQVWLEKEAAKGLKPDKGGWVMTEPLPREYRV
uniref:Uncharacterized protein TCIL3000_11_7390 n=1 Tax=Trypanosoma congolense (strain IL3000) TaxID=1068625 RepID=G0V0Y5_TRYCI|nr:unnamed protein product [Trypanosoma congolense IL3000]